MKKIFTFIAAALVSISMLALDGVNVMPSGIKATVNDDVTQMTIDYVLNTGAVSLYVEFFDENDEIVALVEIEDADLLAEGAHQTTIDIPLDDIEDPGTYKWTMHAYGGTTTFADVLPVGDQRYNYYLPQDIVVDNNPESEYFGRVYVSESTDGAGDGLSDATKAQVRGIYIYDTQMNFVNGQTSALLGYDGNIGGTSTARAGFKRLAIDPEGYVYVASRDASVKGVYRMDPANPAAAFATVLAADQPVDGIEVVNNKLYVLQGVGTGGTFASYDISTLPASNEKELAGVGDLKLANADVTIRSDRRNGFWIAQHRYAIDQYVPISHITKKGKMDFAICLDSTGLADALLPVDEGQGISYRGMLGLNLDGDLLAVGSNGRAVIFQVEYDENDIPSLTKLTETPFLGANIDGLAFDAAENLYIACAPKERIYVFPIAKEEGMNHCRVFAPSKYAITIEGGDPVEPAIENLYLIGDNQPTPWTPAAGLPMEKTDDLQFEGTFDFTNNLSYFAFVSVQSEDWSVVNTHRFGGATNNQLVADGTVAPLAAGEYCLTVAPGSYHFVVDLEEMTCAVTEIKDALDNVNTDLAPVKILRDGQVLILRNGNEYNILGTSAR